MIAAALFAGSLKADPAQWAVMENIVKWLQQYAWVSAPVLVIAAPIIYGARRMIGPPWLWSAIHDVLNSFQQHVFENQGSPLHHHRVTLFKYTRARFAWCHYPWSGWLVPVSRSGHTTQKSRTVFRVPDDADRAEGIAGQAWARQQIVLVDGLPELSTDKRRLLSEYKRRTWSSDDWIAKRTMFARSYCGIPVEVKGKLWGVIVLDSRSSDAITQNPIKDYHLIGRVLRTLLERVKK